MRYSLDLQRWNRMNGGRFTRNKKYQRNEWLLILCESRFALPFLLTLPIMIITVTWASFFSDEFVKCLWHEMKLPATISYCITFFSIDDINSFIQKWANQNCSPNWESITFELEKTHILALKYQKFTHCT